jgi:hypothetical protein
MKKLNILILSSFVLLSACSDKPQPQPPVAAASVPAKVVYEATLAQGIDFKKDGYPAFIAQVAGMSGLEPWGRWSDADAGGPEEGGDRRGRAEVEAIRQELQAPYGRES